MKKILQVGLTSLICGLLLTSSGRPLGAVVPSVVPRPITVADIIQLNRVQTLVGSQIASFSPDGTRFVILLSKGNIENNTNDYVLKLFRTRDITLSPTPRILASLSSSSNRPAIQEVKWLDDRSIAFLGEHPGEEQQLYVIDADSGDITRLTDHRTGLTAYTIAPNGDTFFIAENPVLPLLNDTTRRDGIVVTKQVLSDLISLRGQREAEEHETLFVERNGRDPVPVQVDGINPVSSIYPPPSLSPDGRYLVVKTMITEEPPTEWSEYQDRWIQQGIREVGSSPGMYRFELIDTTSLKAQPLLNAPTGFAHSDILWAPDSRSVVIAGTYLPLDGTHGPERQARQTKRFAAEIIIPGSNIIPITDEDVRLDKWNASTGTLRGRSNGPDARLVHYQKTGTAWQKMDAKDDGTNADYPIQISLEEDPNTPPRLYALDKATGKESLFLDPNPNLSQFQLGRVEEITFKTSNGATAAGTLYFPANYTVGKKYPLVIQTHADDLSKFLVDGPYTTAFAAQPLAGRGFFVAQLKEDLSRIWTPHEVTDEAAAYEGVIDFLDRRSLIDRERVGIIAFSRTGLPVEYVLTHSKYHFAAATLADISDAGYFRYVALLNKGDLASRDSELANEAAPFGKGRTAWLKNCPGFNLDKVNTPIRLEANEPMSLLFEWEWFAVLSRLGKSVDLLYFPDADHVLVKPAHRMLSQQGNVDWFTFWLKGEEDHDRQKAKEYSRWRELNTRAQRIRYNNGLPD